MNIDCERMLTNIDNSIDDYNGHIQKIMILQVIQHIFCEMSIGGEKLRTSMTFLNNYYQDKCSRIFFRV